MRKERPQARQPRPTGLRDCGLTLPCLPEYDGYLGVAWTGMVRTESHREEPTMGEHEDQRKQVARDRMRDLPAETAAGRIDPESLPEDQREELARRVPRAEEAEEG